MSRWTIFCLLFAGSAVAAENPMFTELRTKGVAMSDGSLVPLAAPFLDDGLDAAGQQAAINKLAGNKTTFEALAARSLQAPVVINIRSPKLKDGLARVVDVGFIAYGNWNQIQSDQFLEGLLRSPPDKTEGLPARSGTLSTEELKKRNITAKVGQGLDERYFFSTVNLLDQVQVVSTRYSVGHRGPQSLILAAKIDPQFNKDSEHPNVWRRISFSSSGAVELGSPTAYTASGFYVKATQLAQPAGAIFIEYHMVFEEPQAWFNGGGQLRSKLPLLIQDEVRTLRRRMQQ